MKILVDADCLIKLTKAGLKEFICKQEKIVIPATVKREVVDAGKSKGHPDAEFIEENTRDGLITLAKEVASDHVKGDQALVAMFKRGRYTAVATDDAKLTRILQATGIPFVLPALLIFSICRRGLIDKVKVRIPTQIGHPFRSKPATYSVPIRPGIPKQTGHPLIRVSDAG
jgi:rRNA-processing protein FCF1